MQVSLKEIMVQYATQKGGGLPLSPQEICNAVVQWVQEYTASALVDVDKIKVQTLESLIEGSETVVVDLNDQGTKLEIHLDYEVEQKLDRALLLPLTPPESVKCVAVDSNNAQLLVDPPSVGTKLYKHSVTFMGDDTTLVNIISTIPNAIPSGDFAVGGEISQRTLELLNSVIAISSPIFIAVSVQNTLAYANNVFIYGIYMSGNSASREVSSIASDIVTEL